MEHLNGQFQGSYKIMVYWSRLAVGFLIFKDGKFKQAPTCLGLLLTLDAFFWGGNLSWFIRDFENIEVQYLLPLTFSKLYLPSTIPKLLLNHLPSAGSRSFLQVCYCTVQKENLMYTVKAMSTIVSFMQSPCTQRMPKFWTFFGQGNPGTLTEL